MSEVPKERVEGIYIYFSIGDGELMITPGRRGCRGLGMYACMEFSRGLVIVAQ